MITALLLANAGVDPEAIVEDYAESVRAMAGAESHSPTHDRQATWSREEVAAWLNATVPIVVDFAEHIDDHLEQIGLHEADRERLRRLVLET